MVSIDCATTTVGDVTLVTLSVSSTDPTHVRIENCLDGPVWPPREQGVPAAGWDDGGFSGVVDGRLALGYACPAEHSKGPPAELIEERPPAEETAPTAYRRQPPSALRTGRRTQTTRPSPMTRHHRPP